MTVRLQRITAEHNDVAVLEYEPRRPRNVWIVAGHGYSSSKHNLDFLCGFLASHGYGVFSLDFPGHKLGASGGELRGVEDLLDAMGAVTAYARKRVKGPLYAMGHSMGAMTALFLAAEDPEIAGTIAITTGFGRPTAIDALQSKGPSTGSGRAVADFRSSYVNGVALPDLVRGIDERFAEALPRLEGRRQLYIAAQRDAMVSPHSVEDLFNRAPEPKKFVTIDSDHTYAGENARGEVLQWLNEWHPR